MQDLPDEVALSILEEIPVDELGSFCKTNKQYRNLCSDRQLWQRIFQRQGLVLLEEGSDLPSWVAIYRNSLISRDKANYILSLYEVKRRPNLSICKPVPLYEIRHAELLGEEDPSLSSLISQDIYRKQLLETRELTNSLQGRNLPLLRLPETNKIPDPKYFFLSKRGDEFSARVAFIDQFGQSWSKSISKERTRDIIYRLCYYGLFKLHESIFSSYEETQTRPRRNFSRMRSTQEEF